MILYCKSKKTKKQKQTNNISAPLCTTGLDSNRCPEIIELLGPEERMLHFALKIKYQVGSLGN